MRLLPLALGLALFALAMTAPPALADQAPCGGKPVLDVGECAYGGYVDVCGGLYHEDFCIYGP